MFECHITREKQDNQKWSGRYNRSPIFNNPKRSLPKPRIFKNRPLSVQKIDKTNIINFSDNIPQHNTQLNNPQFVNLLEGRMINSEFQGSFASNGLSHSSIIQKLSRAKINQNHNYIQMQSNYRSNGGQEEEKYCIQRQLCIKKQAVRFNYRTPTSNHYFQPKVTTQAVSPSRPPRLIHSSMAKQPKFVSLAQDSSKIHQKNLTSTTPMKITEEQDEKKSLSKLDERLKQFIIENKLEKQLKIQSNNYCFMDNILNNNKISQQITINCLIPFSSAQQQVNIKNQISENVPIKSSSQSITHQNYNKIPTYIQAKPPHQIPQIKQKMHGQEFNSYPPIKKNVCYVPLQQSLFKPYISVQQLNQIQTHYIPPQQVIERQAILRNSNSSKQIHEKVIQPSSNVFYSMKNDSVQEDDSSYNKKCVDSPKKSDDDNKFFHCANPSLKNEYQFHGFTSFKKEFIHYSNQPYNNQHFSEQFCSVGSANFRNSTIQNNYDSIIRTSSVSVKQFGVENKITKRSILSSEGFEKSRKIIIQPQYFKPLPQNYQNNRYFDQIEIQQKKVSGYEAEAEQISEIIKKEQENLKYQAWSIKSQESDKKIQIENSLTKYLDLKQQQENSIKTVSDSFQLEQYKQCTNNQAHFHDLLQPISPIRIIPANRTKNNKQLCKSIFKKQKWETRQMMIVLTLIGIGLSLILFQVFK